MLLQSALREVSCNLQQTIQHLHCGLKRVHSFLPTERLGLRVLRRQQTESS